ncbi:MAG TPA: PSD1 and planctomycete cytochrome C domain-containing protein [Candidatus Didemnitutus sp.]|nr:PSD1 and planctomycete cytochrome C domain-containing protein [Candidatus Didemnitutus sp.]
MTRPGIVLVAAALAASLSGATDPAVPAEVRFNRDVRPVMANTCFKCHGPDKGANKANLRLDLPADAVRERHDKSGRVYRPIVPGHPEQSEIWRRITAADPGQVMPPPDSLHLLADHDKAVIKRWIEEGATYEPHWAYIPPKKADIPVTRHVAANPIDHFLLRELEEKNIEPSPAADPRTLIRRLSLDLVGLPPTPAEVDAFLADTTSGAYERLVDRLLASPHFGERMAVGWLDLARFADTVGFHGDQLYNNFPYRDYVIDAFNANLPFDRFTREQLAGDLLPGATPAQQVATAFNRLNMVTREGGAQPKEYLAKYAADRVRTVATTWLGSTMGCCECHDHKYDPFKSRDFYSLAAYFADIKQYGVYQNYDYTPEPELKDFTNDTPFPPEIEVDSPYLHARQKRLTDVANKRTERVAKSVIETSKDRAAALAWAHDIAPILTADSRGWRPLAIVAAKEMKDDIVAIQPDNSVRLGPVKDYKQYKFGDGAELTLTAPAGPVASVRLEVLPDETFGGRTTSTKEDSFTVTLELSLQSPGAEKPAPVAFADGYPEQSTWSYANGALETSITGEWKSAPSLVKQAQALVFILKAPLNLHTGDQLHAKILSENVSRVRLSVSPLGVLPPDLTVAAVAAAVATPEATPEATTTVAQAWFMATGAGRTAEFAAELSDLREIAACRDGRAFCTVTVATNPATTHVLARGNWQDESGEIVAPAAPEFLTGKHATTALPRQTRLDLANWLVSRENPLTARTFVNRLWKQFFGTGLSAVVDDLGTQGEYPVNPELLDWLAVDFMDRGWDMKAMVRLIVTSDAYRRSSQYRPDLAEIDPNNRLLARQTPRRLEAEFVRDNALAAAGLIDLELGGPSVHPYQPEGYYAALQFPDRDYYPEKDERQFRRGVYMHWQRTFLHPMLANFDAPSREECTAARIQSSTPQQALTLLNDPSFVECARGLAEVSFAAHPGTGFDSGLNDAFSRLLARSPTEHERAALAKFDETQLAYYRAHPDDAKKLLAIGIHPIPSGVDPAELAAWTEVARVLINLNESIVRY